MSVKRNIATIRRNLVALNNNIRKNPQSINEETILAVVELSVSMKVIKYETISMALERFKNKEISKITGYTPGRISQIKTMMTQKKLR